jgi:dihydrofolate reductase
MRPSFSAIFARTPSGGFGRSGTLPWHVPSDLKRFKTITQGNVVVMGRKTWDSLPIKPLPRRDNVVLTRSACGERLDDSTIALTLEDCIERRMLADGGKKWFIIGGAELIHTCFRLGLISELHLTTLKSDVDCDVHVRIPEEIERCRGGHPQRDDGFFEHAWTCTERIVEEGYIYEKFIAIEPAEERGVWLL